MKGLKKLAAIILCAVLTFTAIPMSAFAAEERTVIDSGFCGAFGENLTWTFYDDGELVISGEGEMDWYSLGYGKLPPWYKYRFDIWNITLEHGVTSIGTHAFYFAEVDDKIPPLCKIELPKTLYKIQNNAIDNRVYTHWHKSTVCFAGTETEWNAILWEVQATHRGVIVYEDRKEYYLWREFVSYEGTNLFRHWNVCLNGEQPQPYCKLNGDIRFDSGDSESEVFRAEYYLDEHPDAKFVWTIEGDSEILNVQTDRYGIENAVEISTFERGNAVLKLEIVTPDGTVIASDSQNITSRKIAPNDSFAAALQKIFFEIDSIYSGIFGSGILIFSLAITSIGLFFAEIAEFFVSLF